MKVKIDTKEKYHVITIQEPGLSAIMTEAIQNGLLTYLQNPTKNVILVIKDIQFIEDAAARTLINVQQQFYEMNASFVICDIQPEVLRALEESNHLELMNIVPTESEAGDIVYMEEIERELE
jgi:anti-anti-sigma factor